MKMPSVMKGTACVTAILALIFSLLKWETAAITCGTTCYHFTMRLLVGYIVDRTMRNQADYHKAWYRQRPWEAKLYKLLGVKKWKGRFPTYDPSLFDSHEHTLAEIVQATCQAEIVHEIIAVLSFLPLLAAIAFGSFAVFAFTSLLSAGFDMVFVIMQRFNRPRLIKLLNKKTRSQ